MTAFESVSSYKSPPPAPSPARVTLLADLAATVCAIAPHRLRIVVDGLTGAGKSTFADELTAAMRSHGRPTLRASLDDFRHPWRHAREHGYDRITAEGYYRNPHDFTSTCSLLLEPAGPHGSGRVVLCAYDPLTGADHRAVAVDAPTDAVLVFDGVFGMRPEYDHHWDLRIWLAVDPAVARTRATPLWKAPTKRRACTTNGSPSARRSTCTKSTRCAAPISSSTTPTSLRLASYALEARARRDTNDDAHFLCALRGESEHRGRRRFTRSRTARRRGRGCVSSASAASRRS